MSQPPPPRDPTFPTTIAIHILNGTATFNLPSLQSTWSSPDAYPEAAFGDCLLIGLHELQTAIQSTMLTARPQDPEWQAVRSVIDQWAKWPVFRTEDKTLLRADLEKLGKGELVELFVKVFGVLQTWTVVGEEGARRVRGGAA